MIGKTVSHYEILEKLGSGGMGVVYKARDLKLKRLVALKFLPQDLTRDADARKRFIHEGRAASSLEHSNICSIYEINETDDGRIFIAMAYYDGEPLSELIKKGPVNPEKASNIALQIAEGLAEAHENGIVHRDIKSANIILTAKGQAKILDFGLAQFPGKTRLTKTGSTLGTAPYMSPEQISGEPVDNQTDIWALGVIFYEMLAGRLPFAGEYEQALLFSIVNEEPPPLHTFVPDLSRDYQLIIDRSLAKKRDNRYHSVNEMVEDLKALTDAGTGPARPGPEKRSSKKPYLEKVSCDVFISHAPIDDKPLSEGQNGWITTFHQALELRLEQLLGADVKVLSDKAELKKAQNSKTSPNPALFIPVLSPHYIKSKTCTDELQKFIDSCKDDAAERIFKAVKTPLSLDLQPGSLLQHQDYSFYQIDPDTGRPREFWPELGAEANRNFWARLEDVAYDVFQKIKSLKSDKSVKKEKKATVKIDGAQILYLAESTYDLTEHRDNIKRQLQQRGHTLLPDKPFSLDAVELKKQIADFLQASKLSIHLIGERYGIIPEGEKRSIAELQYDLAMSAGKDERFSSIIWIAPGLRIEDERQQRFLDNIQLGISRQRDVDILRTSVEEFRNYVIDKIEKMTKIRKRPDTETDISRVYLQCDQPDLDATAAIEEYLFDKGYEVKLTAFEGDEIQVFEAHKENLLLCDGTIIYYGDASDSWVTTKMADLLKIAGYGRTKPLKAKAIYVSYPETKNKQRFRTREAMTLKSFDKFQPEVLEPFIRSMSNGKEMNG